MKEFKIKIICLILMLSIVILTEAQRSRQRNQTPVSTSPRPTRRPTTQRTTTIRTTTVRTTTTPRPPRTTTPRPTRRTTTTTPRPTTVRTTTIRTTTTPRPRPTTTRPRPTTPRPRPTTPKPKRRKPNRNRNRGKQEPDTRLQCYTCYADFERIPFSVQNPAQHIYNNNCYNPSLNYTAADAEYLTRCASGTKFCMVDITRLNNVLLSVDRRCGGATCRKTCLARGYGVIRETCTFCCGGRHTEDDPEYDEDEHGNYKCPMEPH